MRRSIDRRLSPPGARVLVAFVSAALALGACREQQAERTAPPPPEVQVTSVAAATVPVQYEFIGQTDSSKTVQVRAKLQGYLLKRTFEEGGRVKEGDPLFMLDARSFQAEVDIATARVAQARASLDLAEVTLKRVKSAFEQGGTNQQEVDTAKAQRDERAAAAELAKANLDAANVNLSYTKIASPVTGRIGKAMKEEGALVDSGQNSLLTEVVQYDPIYVNFTISEREILEWQTDVRSGRITYSKGTIDPNSPGGKIECSISLIDGTPYDQKGTLNFVDVRIDPGTGTGLVRAEFANPQERLKPGQFVKIQILGWERPNTLTVPQQAVLSQPNGQFVLIADAENKVELRPVTTGQWLGSDWVIERGVKPGDRVIVEGVQKIQPGMTVRVAGG